VCFATGDFIDTGLIQGKIFTNKSDNYYLFCYLLNDTIDYFNKPPDYRSPIANNGTYTIPALKNATYRVIAVLDADKDALITHLRDTIALPTNDIVISQFNNNAEMNFIPYNIVDTLPPDIIECRAINSNEVIILFNEPIRFDSNTPPTSFSLYSRQDETILPANLISIDSLKKNEIKLFFNSIINKETS